MRLKDYAKTLYEVNQDNKCSRTGQVEGVDYLDEENSRKFREYFRITSSPNLVRILKREFGTEGISFFLSNFREFCDDHDIKYSHEAWY